ncbi:MAG TPA: transposase [Gammaproteobacteria bacterium]|nr:transposase [Gammaproteobacteria bacterium]
MLSRAGWSGLQGAKILLGLLVLLVPCGWPLLIGVDETIERRSGRRIKAKGCYRDAVRSTQKVCVKCFGLKWISMMLIVPVPWSGRCWALPCLTVLAPSKRANEKAQKRHKTTVNWTVQMVKGVARWLGRRAWALLGDGSYACVELAWTCLGQQVTLVSRLRLDAQLYEFPAPVAAGRRGPKPKKGKKLPALKTRLEEAQMEGDRATAAWYGGERNPVRLLTGVCLGHTPGERPLPIRWVLVVDPTGKARSEAFFSPDPNLIPETIVEWFVLRWNVEVTFEEGRRHLGLETQRQWSDKAIARTTPALLGLFSLLCLMAYRLLDLMQLPLQSTAWYLKQEATFSDVLAFVRRAIWAGKYLDKSISPPDQIVFHRTEWETLLDQLASTG